MKRSELPPQMSNVNLWVYLIILAIAFLIGCYGTYAGVFSMEKVNALAMSEMVTLFVLSTVALIPELARRLRKHSQAAKFERFFGAAALKSDILLVFPSFSLKSGMPVKVWDSFHRKEVEAIPEGVRSWLAAEDVRASVYVSQTLSNFTSQDIIARRDRDVDYDNIYNCVISFGLGFNGLTERLARWCNDELFSTCIEKLKSKYLTDSFCIGTGTSKRTPTRTDKEDHCIIARVVSDTAIQGEKPKHVSFVCAGRTAAGTAVAGYFLAKRWTDLYDLYETDHPKSLNHDSLVVVIRHQVDALGKQDYETRGEIAVDSNNKPMIAWWPEHKLDEVGKAAMVLPSGTATQG